MANNKSYFSKFPIISYDGVPSLNIMKRVDFNANIRTFLTHFYPTNMNEGSRIDSVAFDYYDSVDYDWIIYHSNGIIDPYYDTLQDTYTFDEFIRKKYGSVQIAKRRTAFYRNNYLADDTLLSVQGYTSLNANEKKYWKPEVNAIGVVGYSRAEENFTVSTNIIQDLFFEEPMETPFIIGEIVRVETSADDFAEVTWSSVDSCQIRHVRGSFFPPLNGTKTITSETSKRTATIIEARTIHDVIPNEERKYFSPVSFYDVEQAKNDETQEIYLIDKTQTQRLNKELTNLLK